MRKSTLNSLSPTLQQIITDFPNLIFKRGSRFTFRPPNIIILGPKTTNYELLTLHEIGHALSNHKNYKTYLELLRMETEAWRRAKPLAQKYQVPYNEDLVQSHLNTYRDYLYLKTTCPHCGNYCIQSSTGKLFCPFCQKFAAPPQKPKNQK